jgi:aspartate kinase
MTATDLHTPGVDGLPERAAELSDTIVAKFGGTSVATAEQIEKVRRIVALDERRRFVVVSAPGKAHPDEEKITDHLFNIATDGQHFADRRMFIAKEESRKAVLARFEEIVRDLGLAADDLLRSLEHDLDTDLEGDLRGAFLASRGEHYSARVIASYFAQQGMPTRVALPEDFGLLVDGSALGARLTPDAPDRIAALDGGEGIVVIPGYYGVTADGDISVFSRGGSDLTAGEVASAVDAGAYENWTDVSGVLEADPRIIPEARAIPRLTFKEIRLLAAKGFNVFHFDAMLRCRRRGVPIHIRNTSEPEAPGTRILNERVPEEGVVGIARIDDVASVYLEKDELSEEVGFTATLLRIFHDFGVHTHHYPTDKDDIAVLVDQDDLKGTINDLRRSVETELRPDLMDVTYNLSVLTPVGLGVKHNSKPIVDAINALGEANIAIEGFHQSPSRFCFHITVANAEADAASRVLYEALIRQTGDDAEER